MKIELSHDALAKRIYEKASTEDKMRLRITNFIRGRYLHYLDNRILLQTDDLNYVGPYLKGLDLTEDEQDFLKRSTVAAKRRKFGMVAVVSVAFITMAVLFGKAEHRKRDLENTMTALDAARLDMFRSDSLKSLTDSQLKALAAELKVANDSIRSLVEAEKKRADEESARAETEAKRAEVQSQLAEQRLVEVKKREAENQKTVAELTKVQTEVKQLRTTRDKFNGASSSLGTVVINAEEKAKLESKILSGQAVIAFRNQDNRALAYRLAREAYEQDPKNSEAFQVLRWIQSTPSYFDKNAPMPRVNASEATSIIDKFKSYGTLSSSERKSYLNR